MSADAAVGEPERLHPWYLITGLGRALRQMVGGYAAIGYLAATGSWRTAFLALAATTIVMVGGTILFWRRFEYRVGTDEIRIDSGIFNRNHRSIPFDRIQDVDIRQGPVARLLGLARVEFETGGGAGEKGDDGALAAIALARAEALRDLVRARRGARVEGPSTPAPAAPLYAMDLRRVLLAGLFNFSLALIAGLFGAIQTFGDIAGFDIFARRFWRGALEAGSPIADLVLAHQIAAGFAGALLLLVVGLATGVARTLLRDYRFRLDRTDSGFRRRRGLLTLTDVSLPTGRVQAAIVATGPLRKRFGWRALSLQSLASDGGEKGDYLVAPLAGEDEVAVILAELGWPAMARSTQWQPASPAYFRAYAWPALLLLPVAAMIAVLVEPLAGGALAAAAGALVALRWQCWKRYRFALDEQRLLVRSGWWRRRLVILPLASIQSVDIVHHALGRRLGVASLCIGVASGRGYSSHGIALVPLESAREIRARLLAVPR